MALLAACTISQRLVLYYPLLSHDLGMAALAPGNNQRSCQWEEVRNFASMA